MLPYAALPVKKNVGSDFEKLSQSRARTRMDP